MTSTAEPDGVQWSDDSLFYGTLETLEQLTQVAQSTLATIRQSGNARLVVIETWLLLDYAVREFLLSGFELGKLSVESCDLRYRLLPTNFTGCLAILDQLTKAQSALPEPPKQIDNRVAMSVSFLLFLKDEHPDDLERLRKLEQEYYKKRHPDLAGGNVVALDPETAHRILGTPAPKYAYVNPVWLKVAQGLTEDWYKNARRLNEARNQAAHSFDREKILGSMGLAGPKALDHLKAECEQLVATLVGVKGNVGLKT